MKPLEAMSSDVGAIAAVSLRSMSSEGALGVKPRQVFSAGELYANDFGSHCGTSKGISGMDSDSCISGETISLPEATGPREGTATWSSAPRQGSCVLRPSTTRTTGTSEDSPQFRAGLGQHSSTSSGAAGQPASPACASTSSPSQMLQRFAATAATKLHVAGTWAMSGSYGSTKKLSSAAGAMLRQAGEAGVRGVACAAAMGIVAAECHWAAACAAHTAASAAWQRLRSAAVCAGEAAVYCGVSAGVHMMLGYVLLAGALQQQLQQLASRAKAARMMLVMTPSERLLVQLAQVSRVLRC